MQTIGKIRTQYIDTNTKIKMAQEEIYSRERPISESGGDDEDHERPISESGGDDKGLSVSFMFRGGTADTRLFAWQAILVFCGHTPATSIPAGIFYPGLADPGADMALPLSYASYQGLFHLLACLTRHASGAGGRGGATTLEITVAGQPMFGVVF
jgi:hypothetical protein